MSEVRGPAAGRTRSWVGYLSAIIANVVIWWVVHAIPGWDLPFVTESFPDVLWALELSIAATIVANALFLSYDGAPFKRLLQLFLDLLAFLSVFVLYTVFPFDFGLEVWDWAVQMALVAAMIGVAIAIIVDVVRLARAVVR